MDPSTFFWVKSGLAILGIVVFVVWFRAYARKEHEQEMDRLAVKTDPRYIRATNEITEAVVKELLYGGPSESVPFEGLSERYDKFQGSKHPIINPPCPQCGRTDWWWVTRARNYTLGGPSDDHAVRSCCRSEELEVRIHPEVTP